MADIQSTPTPGSGKPTPRDDRRFRHGMYDTPEYTTWQNMLDRCQNPRCPGYPGYGGRGITVCDRWRDSFAAFYEDLGPRPSPKHSLDRIDNDSGYSPENCRWTTWDVQQRNRRDNVYLEHAGKRMTMFDWAEEIGMDRGTFSARIRKGWSAEKAITTPANSPKRRTNPGAAVPPKPGERRYRGVSWRGRGWVARIWHEEQKHHLGTFNTAIEAAIAYDEAARRLKGDKAILNLPDAS